MWVFTQHGFLSIAMSREDHEVVMVRSRDRKSLEQFIEAAEADEPLEVLESAGTDYRYRIICSRKTVAAYLAVEALGIDYSNFKDRVTKTRGSKWHDVLMSIWGKVHGLSDRERSYSFLTKPVAHRGFAGTPYCEGTTTKGRACWHLPRTGYKTCWQHADQEADVRSQV